MNGESFKDVRRRMVDSQLRPDGVTDARVLWAMAEVPRERFVAPGQAGSCYRDTMVPLAGGRALNAPAVAGRMLDAARVQKGERVLLVGAATGYLAAVLAMMEAHVVALECDETLLGRARAVLDGDARVELVSGPLAEGWPAGAPYDLVVIDGAVAQVPQAIEGQIRTGGRLVGAIADRGVTRLVEGMRSGTVLGLAPFAEFETAILPGFAPAPAFSF